jgi:hypothetical protein
MASQLKIEAKVFVIASIAEVFKVWLRIPSKPLRGVCDDKTLFKAILRSYLSFLISSGVYNGVFQRQLTCEFVTD